MTAGISRNMQWDIGPLGQLIPGVAPLGGGGNLNGSAATALLGQAGTAARKEQRPRQATGNYCGVV